MTARLPLLRAVASRAALASALLGPALGPGTAHAQASAQPRAPSEAELAAARALFQEAYRDEQEHRFAAALEKFQRVAAVKESAAVRYRIASVLSALGRLRESRDTFRALAVSRTTLAGNELDIADSAGERAQVLDRRIPRLVLRLDRAPSADTRVSIDGAPVSASIAPRRFELDPGEHVVTASAASTGPWESKVVVVENTETPLVVVLAPRTGRAAAAEPVTVTAPPPVASRSHVVPVVALAAGGALVATSAILLVVRENDIAELEDACRDVCPVDRRASLESTRDQAELFGPLAVGFGVAGVALSAVGLYVLLRAEPASMPPVRDTSAARRAASGMRLGARPTRDGAMMSLGASF